MSDELQDKIQSEREEALATLSEVVDHARYKSLGDGRIRNPEAERVRLKFLRVIVSAESERRKILADKELEELEERLEAIEERQNSHRIK
ncbi:MULTISPECIES: hypothetical protein [Halorubrum]|uniref:DUF8136 domain-containing protein n=2 Tax=Halorubrum TaxID=56688 RepID=A0ABD5SBE4_9EURY|nr:hypothetical protein [Halorubrum alkaliphilum]MBP1923095.1 putative house-cleaning noncanonical NTP pyrophosphatase (MazG superfamily) [Halorubrum alkaliphilum]